MRACLFNLSAAIIGNGEGLESLEHRYERQVYNVMDLFGWGREE